MTDGTSCERHGAPTQLACATCGALICPDCLVRTAVGFKCRACTGRTSTGATKWPVRVGTVLLAAVVIGIPFGVRALSDGGRSDGGPALATAPAAGIGDEVRDAGLTFTVRSVECEPGADGQVCVMSVGAVNQGTGPEELFGRLQFLVDEVGRRYGPEETFDLFFEELNPGEEGNLRLIFELPADVTIDEAELHTYPNSLGARVGLDRT